jgi:hypothetical protein
VSSPFLNITLRVGDVNMEKSNPTSDLATKKALLTWQKTNALLRHGIERATPFVLAVYLPCFVADIMIFLILSLSYFHL